MVRLTQQGRVTPIRILIVIAIFAVLIGLYPLAARPARFAATGAQYLSNPRRPAQALDLFYFAALAPGGVQWFE